MIGRLASAVLVVAMYATGAAPADPYAPQAAAGREEYPPEALRRREQGDVKLSMCVGADGRARDVKLVQSSGSDALDEASLAAMKKVRFNPGKDGAGKPIEVCDHVMTIAWRLPE